MNKPIVTDSWERYRFGRNLAALGFVLGFCAAMTIASAAREPEVIDPRMERACQWPKRHGQAMMVAVIDGKILCWEMGR
jgi:hypothetical protein